MWAATEFADRALRLALLAVLAAGLSGCGGFSLFGEAGPPPRVYELSPKATVANDVPKVSWQLVVEEPFGASAVNTDRIAARTGEFEYVYYSGVRWSDRAPKMVQTVLVESFENSGRIVAVGRQAIGLRSDYELKSDLREFQVHRSADGGAPVVWVEMNFKLVEQPSAQIVAFMTAGQQVPAADGSMPALVQAFEVALGKVVSDGIAWTLKAGEEHYRKSGQYRYSRKGE